MDTKLFKIGKGILLSFLIIYVGSLIDWIFYPLIVVFQTLFVPIVLSGFLFYLLRPLVKIINRKLSRGISILLVYLALISILLGLLLIVVPILQRQFDGFINNIPLIISGIQRDFIHFHRSDLIQVNELNEIFNIDELILQLGNLLSQMGQNLALSMANFIGALGNTVIVLVIVPFTLFYMLKDGEKLNEYILRIFNEKQRKDIQLILKDIDKTLSSYIQGQGIVCLCVGTLCYIAFTIVGLNYALLLAVIAGLTNIIPYFGPWIGTVPSVIVALFQSPALALIIIILVLIIQQVESSFIAPQVIGKKLKMHPITVMFIILIAGRLIGLIGMILAVPTYAISRVILTHSFKIWKLKRKEK